MSGMSQAEGAYYPLSGDSRGDALKRALAANALTESDLALIAAVLRAEETRSLIRGRDSRVADVRRVLRKVTTQRKALRAAAGQLPAWAKRGAGDIWMA